MVHILIQGRNGSGDSAAVNNSGMSMTLRESGGGTNSVGKMTNAFASGLNLNNRGEWFSESGKFNFSLPQFKLFEAYYQQVVTFVCMFYYFRYSRIICFVSIKNKL